MRKIYLMILLLSAQLSFAQGIVWETDIETAFRKAKAANKLVFVECYLPTCPVCQNFEPILKSAAVGEYFNKNFINYKLNGEKAEQVKFLNNKNIYLPSFPMFLFFDADGNLVHQAEAGESKEENVISVGKTAFDSEKRASSYKKRYDAGERDLNFLVKYALFSRVVRDTTTNLAVAAAAYEVFPKQDLGNATSWGITRKVVQDIDNGFAQYWFDHVAEARQLEISSGHTDGEKNIFGVIIQGSLYSPRGQGYSSAKVARIRELMYKVGFSQYAEGATWQFESKALFREGQAEQAVVLVDNFARKLKANGPALVYIASFLLDNTIDKTYLSYPQKYLTQARPLLKEYNQLVEYYYHSARWYLRNGENASALKELAEAEKYAVLGKIDTKKIKSLAGILK